MLGSDTEEAVADALNNRDHNNSSASTSTNVITSTSARSGKRLCNARYLFSSNASTSIVSDALPLSANTERLVMRGMNRARVERPELSHEEQCKLAFNEIGQAQINFYTTAYSSWIWNWVACEVLTTSTSTTTTTTTGATSECSQLLTTTAIPLLCRKWKKPDEPNIRKIYMQALQRESSSEEALKAILSSSELPGGSGSNRPLMVKVKNASVTSVQPGDVDYHPDSKGDFVLNFDLPCGSFATVLLRELFKNNTLL
jgi:tRNA(Glu) U13 pseudouridine synthase TruD